MSANTLRASFVAPRKALIAAFAVAANNCPSRTPKELLKNVRVGINGHVRFESTDQESYTTVDAPHESKEGDAVALVPAKRFAAALKAGKSPTVRVEIDNEAKTVKIDGGAATFAADLDPDEFPTAYTSTGVTITATADAWRRAFSGTIYATDVESTRYALGGVLVEVSGERVDLAATDSRRLAVIQLTGAYVSEQSEGANKQPVIPASAVERFAKALAKVKGNPTCWLTIGKSDCEFVIPTSDVKIWARLVEGRFPRWRDVVPKADRCDMTHLTFAAGELSDALAQVMVVTDTESRGVDFTIEANSSAMLLEAQNTDGGRAGGVVSAIAREGVTDRLACTCLDPKFVREFCATRDKNEPLVMSVIDHEAAVTFRPASDALGEYVYVIAPLARNRKV